MRKIGDMTWEESVATNSSHYFFPHDSPVLKFLDEPSFLASTLFHAHFWLWSCWPVLIYATTFGNVILFLLAVERGKVLYKVRKPCCLAAGNGSLSAGFFLRFPKAMACVFLTLLCTALKAKNLLLVFTGSPRFLGVLTSLLQYLFPHKWLVGVEGGGCINLSHRDRGDLIVQLPA